MGARSFLSKVCAADTVTSDALMGTSERYLCACDTTVLSERSYIHFIGLMSFFAVAGVIVPCSLTIGTGFTPMAGHIRSIFIILERIGSSLTLSIPV